MKENRVDKYARLYKSKVQLQARKSNLKRGAIDRLVKLANEYDVQIKLTIRHKTGSRRQFEIVKGNYDEYCDA